MGALIIFSGWQNIAPCMNGLTAHKTGLQNGVLSFFPIKERKLGPNWRISIIVTSLFIIWLTSFAKMFGQKALVLQALLSHENYSESQNDFKSGIPRPPAFSDNFAWSLETLSGLLSHKKLKITFSNFLSFVWFKSGSTDARWLSFERASVLIITILP